MIARRLIPVVLSIVVFALGAARSARAVDAPPPNTLSDAERAAGWRLLFDGKTTAGWRGFRKTSFPTNGWAVADGCLRHLPKGGGGDIVTVDTFGDYEFAFEWRINAGGNGGVKYFITESRPGEAVGHEYQLMGEASIAEIRGNLLHATASFYDVLPVPTDFPFQPPETWQQSRIIVRGDHVEHWLNGSCVLTYELGSDAVKAGVARSKFKNVPGFATKFPHLILLQDHGGDIRFRNLKLHPLPAATH